MSDKNKYSLQSDASIGTIVQGLENAFNLAKLNWRLLVIFPIVFALLGLVLGTFFNNDVKKAEFIIAAEEEGPSGMENLLAQFGLDVGGSNPGGVFEGESLVKLFQIRSLVERSLLTEFNRNGKKQLLAEAIYSSMDEAKNVKFKDVKFHLDRSQNNAITDSALYLMYKYVKKDMLSVSRPDKKQSFVTVSCVHQDPEVAIATSANIIETVTDYYVETLTKKARHNLNVLKLEADSIQQALNKNLHVNAANTDLNLNPLMQSARVGQNRSLIELQISISLYGEVIKNLKLAEIGLRKQTPLIQIIESPHYPLETVGMNWFDYVFGGLGLGFMVAFYLIYRRESAKSSLISE
jgi:hypothetical protein